ncbi:MAG: hypothetical protein Q9165_005797 [Trypethelium subeluteriae]
MPFAETIGLIASCVQLAELATKSIKNLHSLELKFKNAATTFELLSAQLLALKSAAKHISLWLDEAPPESIWSAELRDNLVRSIEACGTLLQKISEHSIRLENDSGTALLLERMKYVWKADEFREYQELLRDHVQALSFLLQVAQIPSRSQQDTLLNRNDSRRIIDKPRDESLPLLHKDDQVVSSPVEPIGDDLSRFSIPFGIDYEALISSSSQSTLASFMKQKLRGSEAPPLHAGSESLEPNCVTLQDVLDEIDEELETADAVEKGPRSEYDPQTNCEPGQTGYHSSKNDFFDENFTGSQPSAKPSRSALPNEVSDLCFDGEPWLEGPFIGSPRGSLSGPSNDKRDAALRRIATRKSVGMSAQRNAAIFEFDGRNSKDEYDEQGREAERVNESRDEPRSLEFLRKVHSTPQVKSVGSIHRTNAHKAKRAHSESENAIMPQLAIRPADLPEKEDPIDELVILFDNTAEGRTSDSRKVEELALRLRAKPSFLLAISSPNFHRPSQARQRLSRRDNTGSLAARSGVQSELEAFNGQAIQLGHPTVGQEDFQKFQTAWSRVDPTRTRYIPKEALPRLVEEFAFEGSSGMSIYEGNFTVSRIVSDVLPTRTSCYATPAAELANILNDNLKYLNVPRIRTRRKRLKFFFYEVLFLADPGLGLNFSQVLRALLYYKDLTYFEDWKRSNKADIKWAIGAEGSTLLERFIRRRARLQRVEELASQEVLRGWMLTLYWRKRFKSDLEAKKMQDNSQVTQAAALSTAELE